MTRLLRPAKPRLSLYLLLFSLFASPARAGAPSPELLSLLGELKSHLELSYGEDLSERDCRADIKRKSARAYRQAAASALLGEVVVKPLEKGAIFTLKMLFPEGPLAELLLKGGLDTYSLYKCYLDAEGSQNSFARCFYNAVIDRIADEGVDELMGAGTAAEEFIGKASKGLKPLTGMIDDANPVKGEVSKFYGRAWDYISGVGKAYHGKTERWNGEAKLCKNAQVTAIWSKRPRPRARGGRLTVHISFEQCECTTRTEARRGVYFATIPVKYVRVKGGKPGFRLDLSRIRERVSGECCAGKIVEPDLCDFPAMERPVCENNCSKDKQCTFTYRTRLGKSCYSCKPKPPPPPPPDMCDAPAMEEGACNAACSDGECRFSYQTTGGKRCFLCWSRPQPPEECWAPHTRFKSRCEANCERGQCLPASYKLRDGASCYYCKKDPPPQWGWENPCPPCQPLKDALDHLYDRWKQLHEKRRQTWDKIGKNGEARDRARKRVKLLESRLSARGGTGGKSTDPKTGITISSYDQGDGTVRITIRNREGRIIEERTRPVETKEQIRQRLEKARAELKALEEQEQALRKRLQEIEKEISGINKKIPKLRARLEDCIAKRCKGEACDAPFMDRLSCSKSCPGRGGKCEFGYTTSGGAECFQCRVSGAPPWDGGEQISVGGGTTIEIIDVKHISGNNPYDRVDPVAEDAGDGTPDGGVTVPSIRVIKYGTFYFPVDQLTVAAPDACPADHYHAVSARACDGSLHADPDPFVCGFGLVSATTTIPLSSCANP